jgi:hypothetical protein
MKGFLVTGGVREGGIYGSKDIYRKYLYFGLYDGRSEAEAQRLLP